MDNAPHLLPAAPAALRYSQLINGCKKAKINLNRKMLSEIAIARPRSLRPIRKHAKAANRLSLEILLNQSAFPDEHNSEAEPLKNARWT